MYLHMDNCYLGRKVTSQLHKEIEHARVYNSLYGRILFTKRKIVTCKQNFYLET